MGNVKFGFQKGTEDKPHEVLLPRNKNLKPTERSLHVLLVIRRHSKKFNINTIRMSIGVKN